MSPRGSPFTSQTSHCSAAAVSKNIGQHAAVGPEQRQHTPATAAATAAAAAAADAATDATDAAAADKDHAAAAAAADAAADAADDDDYIYNVPAYPLIYRLFIYLFI